MFEVSIHNQSSLFSKNSFYTTVFIFILEFQFFHLTMIWAVHLTILIQKTFPSLKTTIMITTMILSWKIIPKQGKKGMKN